MSKMVQVRNVPDPLHLELVRRAKARGQTLSDYIRTVLEREVERPPAEEVFDRVRRLPRLPGAGATALIRPDPQVRRSPSAG